MDSTAAGPGAMLHMLVMFGIMFGVMYFLLIRPQQKKEKERLNMIRDLKKGDKIVTTGGLLGSILGVQDDYVVMKVGEDGVKLEVLKSAVSHKTEK